MTGELWTHRLLATDPTSPRKRFSKLCCPLQRRLELQRILLLGPITGDGLRATHRSREPVRYRVRLARYQASCIPWGSAASVALDTGRCQRITRLENLCGVRSSIDRYCPAAACA